MSDRCLWRPKYIVYPLIEDPEPCYNSACREKFVAIDRLKEQLERARHKLQIQEREAEHKIALEQLAHRITKEQHEEATREVEMLRAALEELMVEKYKNNPAFAPAPPPPAYEEATEL